MEHTGPLRGLFRCRRASRFEAAPGTRDTITWVRIETASDHSLLVTFGSEISEELHLQVRRLTILLRGIPGIRNLHPAYASVLIGFDPLRLAPTELELLLSRLDLDEAPLPPAATVEIPVCYEPEFGPDLAGVAQHTGLTPERVVELHSGADYLVYFLGFSPGFPYLGGMPPELATPRLDDPRKHVPAGSVAIGGNQTGVYPVSSPGGWRIIGRTPMRLFRPDEEPPTLLAMGDRVRFVPISKEKFR